MTTALGYPIITTSAIRRSPQAHVAQVFSTPTTILSTTPVHITRQATKQRPSLLSRMFGTLSATKKNKNKNKPTGPTRGWFARKKTRKLRKQRN
jgi:hypothetical protein